MTVATTSSTLGLWDRITCAVDGTVASFEVAREVAWLMPAGAQLTLRAVADSGSPESLHSLLRDVAASGATMVCVASKRAGHAATLALDSVVVKMLRDAPCSVLVVHDKAPTHRRDGAIVVGTDGSGGGFAALTIARELAQRRSLDLHVLEDPEPTVGMLIDAAVGAELLILGSRHPVGHPGAVSEQVVRRAACPVLVARGSLLGVE